jgi:hypothetical protein
VAVNPVTQRNNKRGEGDCFPACLASILDAPLDVFPIENCKEWNSFHWGQWLEERGITLYGPPRNKGVYYYGYWIAIVNSINNEGGFHAVVMKEGALAWDPNCGNKREYVDLNSVATSWLLVLSDLALFKQSELY